MYSKRCDAAVRARRSSGPRAAAYRTEDFRRARMARLRGRTATAITAAEGPQARREYPLGGEAARATREDPSARRRLRRPEGSQCGDRAGVHGAGAFGGRRSWLGVAGEGFEVIAAARHRRKLKRGALKGNDFEITLRRSAAIRSALEARLRAIARSGVPNYFGPQRFGRDGANLRTCTRMVLRRRRACRSLAARLRLVGGARRDFQRRARAAGSAMEPGTACYRARSPISTAATALFVAEVVDAALDERCARSSTFIRPARCGAGGEATRRSSLRSKLRSSREHDVLRRA